MVPPRRSLPPREIAEAALAACRDWTEGELTDDFAVVVRDQDGDSTPGTLTIAIRDDEPFAVRDDAAQMPENAAVVIDVFANDVPGADTATRASVALVAAWLLFQHPLLNLCAVLAGFAPSCPRAIRSKPRTSLRRPGSGR